MTPLTLYLATSWAVGAGLEIAGWRWFLKKYGPWGRPHGPAKVGRAMPRYNANDLYEQANDLKDWLDGRLDKIERMIDRRIDRIQEALVTLQDNADRLGAVVKKLVVDQRTTADNIQKLNDKIEELIANGGGSTAELEALKAQVETVNVSLDDSLDQLEALDMAVDDPTNPIDPNAPV